MLGGIDHDPGMSGPDGQVARLRVFHSPEFVDPRVEVRRTCVAIRETGALVESVDKVGAIGGETMMAGIESGTQNRQSLIPSERPGRNRFVLQVAAFDSDPVSPVRLSLLLFFLVFFLGLRQRGRDGRLAEQEEQQGAFGMEPHGPFITHIRRAAQVTGVPAQSAKSARTANAP